MSQQPISAVCFDLFETLITEYVEDYRPGPTLAEQLHVEPDQFARAWSARIPARFRGELIDFPATLRDICAECNVEAPTEKIAALHKARLREKAQPFANIEPHILAMLTALRNRGLKLGLISNASREEVAAWHGCDLARYFDATIFSFEVGNIKPEAAIYQVACESLALAPTVTLFVGDGGSQELMGALRAGMRPCWATWFLDQWPIAKQSASQWQENAQFTRLQTPADLLKVLDEEFLG